MRTTILIAALLVVSGFAIAGGSEENTTWRTIADEPLIEAYDAGEESLTLVVQGPHVPDPVQEPRTRDEWRAHWEHHSGPFLNAFEERVDRLGGTVTSTVPAVNAAFATIPSDRLPTLLDRPDIRRAGLDWEDAVTLQEIDSGPGILVDLEDTIAKVQAQDMWARGYQGSGVSLAVIDTGIRGTHEMMRNADGTTRVTNWEDVTNTPGCNDPCDGNGHGTHVATTAAGSNLYNPNSPQGVAPLTDVWGVKIFPGSSSGGSWENAQDGLQAAFDMGADISTNSWGGGCSGGGVVTAELAETLQHAGMINVFAAGNSGGGGVICPGAVHDVITVGAIDINDNVAGFSSRGPCEWPAGSGNERVCPDVNAVGVNVVAGCPSHDQHYCSKSGTSMSTPHVAGVVVLLMEAKRAELGADLSAPDTEAQIILRYTSKDLGAGGPDNDYGWGTAQTVDAYNLLTSDEALNIGDLFTVAEDEIRQHEENTFNFAVANLGSVSLSGRYAIDLEQTSFGDCPPSCHEVTLLDETVTLDPLQEKWETLSVSGGSLPAGDYEVTASYAYTYTDPDDGLEKDGLVEHTDTFTVRRVEWTVERGFPAEAHIGEPLLGGIVLKNIGNDDARNVRFREVFNAQGTAPLATAPPGDGQWGVFANPGPTNVQVVSHNPLIMEYTWNDIGSVDGFGDDWEAAYNFEAGQLGEYVFEGTITYQDPTGRSFTETVNQPITVGLPIG